MSKTPENLLHASSRIAMAAYLHDLGKFAERAAIFAKHPRLDEHLQLYCPEHQKGSSRWWSHKHAAHTALAFDELEGYFPDLIRGNCYPFASRTDQSNITDSLINAAAAHHKPDTLLQWIIATADRVASGFEREEFEQYNQAEEKSNETGKNHYQARQLTLFENIRLRDAKPATNHYCYPLKPLAPEHLMPVKRASYEPSDNQTAQAQYAELWQGFVEALKQLPHRDNWPLWLDHFDTLWLTFSQAIPSATAFGTRPDVSLYDHSKTTAALAVALWRWQHQQTKTENDAQSIAALKSRQDWDSQKLLLIQGDFFGIQDFIFASGSQTNKHSSKLLRGRSFYVSLLTELAALKVLETLELPGMSQVTNAAGKFLILAPNTPEVRQKLKALRHELNQWFLQQSYGQAGLGLAWLEASCNDLVRHPNQANRFELLMTRLFQQLEQAKLQRFDLTGSAPCVLNAHYPFGVCAYNDKLPADSEASGSHQASCALSRDQIEIGNALTRFDRLLVVKDQPEVWLNDRAHLSCLELPIFGYRIALTSDESQTGRFSGLAQQQLLVRAWDFSLAKSGTQALWNGYARRYINAYVARFSPLDRQEQQQGRFDGMSDEERQDIVEGNIQSLNHLAYHSRTQTPQGWQGQVALMTLKGDVDDLGLIFQKGLSQPSFAKMAALSRQLNAFFAVYLPWLCQQEFRHSYTVFAGGDDFFLIGPWHQSQKLAKRMADQFQQYVAHNPEIHFSAGMSMTKPGLPISYLAQQAETALEQAKAHGKTAEQPAPKNAVCLYGISLPWTEWNQVQQAEQRLDELRSNYRLSTGYVYGLLELSERAAQAKQGKPEAALWRSHFAYRTRRFVVDKLTGINKHQAQIDLVQGIGEQGINKLGEQYRIVLFNHLYRQRH